MFKKYLRFLVLWISITFLNAMPAAADPTTAPMGDWMCPCPGGSKAMGGASSCDEVCFGSSRSSAPSYDYEAERRAQEAAAEEQRKREAELEQQRIDAENKRLSEEAAKKAKFIQDRDATLLRGSTGMRITPNKQGGTELRGSNNTGLKGASKDIGLRAGQTH